MCNHDIDINWFKEILQNKPLIEKLKKIKLIISDIDGCLTNGKVYGEEEIKGFCVQDGFGTVKALEAGLNIAFITGKNSDQTKARAKTLGIPRRAEKTNASSDRDPPIAQATRVAHSAWSSNSISRLFCFMILYFILV